MSEYRNYNCEDIQEYVYIHLDAMTTENLRSKADIAAELSHRDLEINKLKKDNKLKDSDVKSLQFVVQNILEALPKKRDWLDPGIERLAKDLLK